MAWTDFTPSAPELEVFGNSHGIHPLHIEDCRSDEQQAKLEQGNGYLFVVLKLVLLKNDDLTTADLDIFVGADYIATVHKSPVAILSHFAESKAASTGAPDEVLHRVLDDVVDSYLPVLEEIEDRVDLLEDRVVREPNHDLLERIADLLATLLELRRVLANTRRIAFLLRRADTPLIKKELQPFLSDVHDHLERDLASAGGERERLKGLLDIYHSSLASRNNEATRILTVMGTVSLPAVVISSFLGMSLKYPVWMNWPGTILAVIGIIIGVTSGLLWYLKRRDYL
jgi:magnesium transporter